MIHELNKLLFYFKVTKIGNKEFLPVVADWIPTIPLIQC